MSQNFSEFALWLQLVVALVSAGSFTAVIQLGREVLKRRASARLDRGYGNIHKVYEHLQRLLSATNSNRVLVIKSENGGGIPVPGAQVKNSVVFEVCDSEVQPMSGSWQEIPLDQDYSKVLVQVNSDGIADVSVPDLRASSLLTELLEASKSVFARMSRICATPSALLYLSVHYPSGKTLESVEKIEIRRVAHKLCKIFSRHHNLVKRESTQ